ncbi:hypothetical protein [Mucilaginibacter sp.]|uniref:hypothetical protein n=1 Tax=Mucilaginibacter sp. TaxID=1882438 RepID=UPI0026236976|nr:hypothetical protein [Mucilaginibacter sp.]MDB4924426.1 hypothetical protein [Mucilaginibacter sp.]
MEKVRANIIQLLQSELGDKNLVAPYRDQVLINISRADFETRLGNLLQQVYRLIEHHHPERPDHLGIVIRDEDARHENVFKIWKSV